MFGAFRFVTILSLTSAGIGLPPGIVAWAESGGSPRESATDQQDDLSALPEGDEGIAARFPGDERLEDDPAVVFVERFDGGSLDRVAERWESVNNESIMSLSEESPFGSADPHSLLITHTGGRGNGATLYRRLEPGYDRLFYRVYVRFDRDCAPIHHFFHVGGYHPSTPWAQGGAGTRPEGHERFTTGVEPFGDRWRWDFYSYWMEMRGSPPRGQCWGNSFLSDRRIDVRRDEWICLELMMQLNEVGRSDGEMALWVDGEMVRHMGPGFPRGKWTYDRFLVGQGGDSVRWNDETGGPEPFDTPGDGLPFEGFRWRDREELQLNFVWLLMYLTAAPPGHVSRIWYDNLVVATEYIGPIVPPAEAPLLRRDQ